MATEVVPRWVDRNHTETALAVVPHMVVDLYSDIAPDIDRAAAVVQDTAGIAAAVDTADMANMAVVACRLAPLSRKEPVSLAQQRCIRAT